MTTIREDDFERDYRPIVKPTGESMLEWDELPDPTARNVWTIVDCDGDLYALPGIHVVNRLHYILTEVEWTDETTDAEWYISENDDEEDAS